MYDLLLVVALTVFVVCKLPNVITAVTVAAEEIFCRR